MNTLFYILALIFFTLCWLIGVKIENDEHTKSFAESSSLRATLGILLIIIGIIGTSITLVFGYYEVVGVK